VQILSTLMLADLPYTVLKGAIYIHPTLAEGFFGLMAEAKPVDEPLSVTATSRRRDPRSLTVRRWCLYCLSAMVDRRGAEQ